MLHLFNKVYIASDSTIDINFDRVVISQRYGIKMYEALDKVASGELIAYGKSLSDINYSELIQTLSNHVNQHGKKVIIYADDANFSKFLATWFKSILKTPSVDSSWNIVDSYIKKEQILKNWRYASTSSNLPIFTQLTKEVFSQDFNSAESFELSVDDLSIEMLLATYLSSGEKKQQLKTALANILSRSMQELVLEIKHTYIKNYKKTNFISLDVDLEFFTQSTLYPNESLGRVSSEPTVDIVGASQEDIDTFKDVATKILTEWDEFKSPSAIVSRISLIDYVRSELSDEQLDYLINFEKTSLSNNRLYSSSDEEKINVYFLDFVLNATKQELNSYTLK